MNRYAHMYLEKDSSAKFWSALVLDHDPVFNEVVVILRSGFLAGHSKCVVLRFSGWSEADACLSKIRRGIVRRGYVVRTMRTVWPAAVRHHVPRNSKRREKRTSSSYKEEEIVRVFVLNASPDENDA